MLGSRLEDLYQSRISAGDLRPDPAQTEALGLLEKLAAALDGYRPPGGRSLLANFLRETPRPLRGLYIYGDVGRGKSMLMDMFFDAANVEHKRRVHFHQFMLEVQARLFRLQASPDEAEGVLPRLARELAKEAWLLCFDEFHVGNIADAMILGRLFSGLFDNGVVVVATSNWPPDELYKNGLQRDRFLPFIDLIKQNMDVFRLAGAVDHRHEQMRATPSYFTPLGEETTKKLRNIFYRLAHGAPVRSMQLPVQGRAVEVPQAARDVAFFTFEELCSKPLAAADYIAIAECFSTLCLDGVPKLSPERRNEIVRLSLLIDTLYEAKVKLFVAAEAPPEQLCTTGELAFDFQRTASRLVEMQSEEYRRKPHLG